MAPAVWGLTSVLQRVKLHTYEEAYDLPVGGPHYLNHTDPPT
jgi:hypothetical protein